MREKWEGDRATREWLDSQKAGSRSTYQTAWRWFLKFTGMTGDQILADRGGDEEFRWEKRTMEFKVWMLAQGQSENSAKSAANSAVRGFFSYHRAPLEFRKTEKTKLAEAERVTEDYRFSREDLKKMADFGDLTEKYVVVAGKSFGLRAGDFLKIRRGDLEAYIDREPPISIGKYMTQKENAPAFPFIDSDAKPVVKLMLEKMDREGRKEPNERVLGFKDEQPLTGALQRLAGKAGINHGNKVVRFHCLREFLIDRLSSFMSESKWKQIVGKKISEGAYVSPDSLREDYARAMVETAFAKPEGDIETMVTKQTLLTLAKLANITEEQIARAFGNRRMMSRRPLTPREEVEVLQELVKEGRAGKNPENCEDGAHCQRVVGEGELPTLLSRGWKVSAVLPSGKIVVSDE
jgi:hypothetical protein